MSARQDELREARAWAWANGQSAGPWAHGLPDDECRRIEARREAILAERADRPRLRLVKGGAE